MTTVADNSTWDEAAPVGPTQVNASMGEPPYVAISVLAEVGPVTAETWRAWVKAEKFPGAIQQGRRYLIPTASVLAEFPALAQVIAGHPNPMGCKSKAARARTTPTT